MIRIIAGGKKSPSWVAEGITEYEKRLRKPYDVKWEFYEEDKLNKILADWNFKSDEYVILTDERGVNISSIELSQKLDKKFIEGKNIVIIIGGAFGVTEEVRKKADFVWSFSNLVFPHMLMRVMLIEQIYRAYEITNGGKYHHI
jgi:23S rRNA (pseudouridine1915-N3)-methyltransferase